MKYPLPNENTNFNVFFIKFNIFKIILHQFTYIIDDFQRFNEFSAVLIFHILLLGTAAE